jgi:hypothetical protein
LYLSPLLLHVAFLVFFSFLSLFPISHLSSLMSSSSYPLSIMCSSRRALEEDVLQNPSFTQPPSCSPLTTLLLALKTFICESLQDKVIAPSVSLLEVLQWREVEDEYLGDLDWFMGTGQGRGQGQGGGGEGGGGGGGRGFPQTVLVEEAVAVYEMLQAGQQ